VLCEFTGEDQSDTGIRSENDVIRRMWKTYEVWISRDEIVDFLLYAASLEASVATRSKMS
jgi:hypothetical protein